MFPPHPGPSRGAPLLRRSTLSLLLCCAGLGLALPAGAQTAPVAAARQHELPAGPLADLLARYAAANGVQLVFDPNLLKGRTSPGLRGRYALIEGFEQLLRGSGLAVVTTPGGYTLRPLAAPAAPQAAAADAATPTAEGATERPLARLPTVYARASRLYDHGGTQVLSATELRRFPSANGDVTSVLKLNPQVQFDNAQLSSLTQGEIAAADISINGAKTDQNLFLLDGLVLNNDLDPSYKTQNHYANVPGAAQGMPLDRFLVCNLQVHDSNVSARYGNFQGGVVQGEMCEANRPGVHGRIAYSLARDEWTELFVDPADADSINSSTSADQQPRWRKESLQASLQARLREDLSLTAYLGLRRSVIPLQTADAGSLATQTTEQTRRNRDATLRLDWRPAADTHAWLILRDQPLEDRYFIENRRLSEYTQVGGGRAISANLEHHWGPLQLRHTLSATQQRNSRRSDVDFSRIWSWSADDKNWGENTGRSTATSVEGNSGNVDSELDTLSYALTAQPLRLPDLAGAEQRLSWGLELTQRDASYGRPNDHFVYLNSTAYRTVATTTCTSPLGVLDTETCSLAPSARLTSTGQYFRTRDVYRAGVLGLRAAQGGLWLEQGLRWSQLELRLGLRADRDELASGAVLSPRLAGTWSFSEANATALNFGLNRYHGRSFFNAALREQRETLKLTGQTRDANWNWTGGTVAKPLNRLDELDVPYDDELMLGGQHRWGGMLMSAKWVHRESRRQLTTEVVSDSRCGNNNQCYVYRNLGRGSADTVSLELQGQRAWRFAQGSHRWSLSFSRAQVRSNHTDYYSQMDEEDADRLVSWRGQIIRYADRPADNYNRPWTARASLSSNWPAANLSLYQFLRWQGGRRQVVQVSDVVHEGQSIDAYEERPLPATLSWDIGLTWQPRIGGHRPSITVNIENLTNRRNLIASGTTVVYERGRSVQLQLAHEF